MTATTRIDASVIVPMFNNAAHIGACLEALSAQDYDPARFEVIVVDNNSTDASVDIVRHFPRVKLFRETVQGDWAARNLGIKKANGDVMAFTDADTAPARSWLRCLVDAVREGGGMVIGALDYNSDSRWLAMMSAYESEKAEFVFVAGDQATWFAHACNMAVPRTLFERLGPFDALPRNSDVLFLHRVLRSGASGSPCFSPEARVCRLDVATLLQYFAKVHTYGRDLSRYAALADARPLNLRERLQVLRSLLRRERYSALPAVACCALLATGAVCYEAGRLRGRRG